MVSKWIVPALVASAIVCIALAVVIFAVTG